MDYLRSLVDQYFLPSSPCGGGNACNSSLLLGSGPTATGLEGGNQQGSGDIDKSSRSSITATTTTTSMPTKDLKETQNVAIGVIAAVIEGVILQPTIYWKTAKAQGLPFTLNPRIIYRGTGASIFNECQMMGLQFGITSYFQRTMRSADEKRNLTKSNALYAAVLGGGLTAFCASPVELIMIQQQLYGGSLVVTPYRIVRFYGFFDRGLMRGLTANILRDSIYVSGMLGLTPLIQDYFLKTSETTSMAQASFYASMIGGSLSAIFSHPFDMIKTCMQGDLDQKVYKGFIQTSKTLWKQGGLSRLYHGSLWRTINVLGTVYVANECRNRLPELLFK